MPVRSGAGQGVDSRLWYNNGMNTRICPMCQKEFASKRSNKICFSRECQRLAYSLGVNYSPTKKPTPTKRFVMKSNGRFGLRYKRGKGWGTQARKCRERDSYTCQQCGKTKSENPRELFDVHHIVPFRKFNGDCETANKLENLVYLCRPCHTQAEKEIRLKHPF